MNRQRKRSLIIGLVLVGSLAVAASVGLHVATRALKSEVEQALGPNSEVAEIVVRWSSIEARDVRIRAPQGWPAPDALRAERIVVTPNLLGLFSARLHVPRLTIDHAYISILRTADGKIRMLPGLLNRRPTTGGSTTPTFTIGTVELRHGMLDFFDASVRSPAHLIRLEKLHARVDDLKFPALNSRTDLQLDGVVKGARHNGRLSITGWAELANRNAEIATRLQGVDLVALQPYLLKPSETGVRSGMLDLTLKSTLYDNHLRAPGTATLYGLKLAPGAGTPATFMGIPRATVITTLKNRKGQITIDFLLAGDLDNPHFSLNESFARRLGGVAGLGGAIRKLFGK